MEGLLLVVVLGFLAYKAGIIGVGTPLPAGTTAGQVVQLSNGSYVQAVAQPSGALVGQPISATQAQSILANSATGAVKSGTALSSGLASIATNGLSFGSAASALGSIAIIGTVITAVISLIRLIFHGADPNQVPAAKTEQVYEAYGLMLQNLYKAGLIQQSTCTSLMQAAITAAQQAEANLQESAPAYASDPKPFTNAVANATRVLGQQITTTQGLAQVELQPLTLAAATANMGSFPSPGWYPASITYATQLLEGTVNNLIQAGTQ